VQWTVGASPRTAPAPRGGERLPRRGRSSSTEGAGEEAGGRAGRGLQMSAYKVETGEGDAPPPRQPLPKGDIPTESMPGKQFQMSRMNAAGASGDGAEHSWPKVQHS